MCFPCAWMTGQVKEFTKRGRPPFLKTSTKQNFGTCGDKGCLRGMWRKKWFSKLIPTIWCIFFYLRCSYKARHSISCKNRRWGAPPASTLDPPLNGVPLIIMIYLSIFRFLSPSFLFSLSFPLFSFLTFPKVPFSSFLWCPFSDPGKPRPLKPGTRGYNCCV